MWCRISKMQELYRARPALPAPRPPHPGGFLFSPRPLPEGSVSVLVVLFIVVITIISVVINKGLGRMPRTF